MSEQTVVEKKRNSPPRGARARDKMRRFTAAEKLKAVRLHLEEGFTMTLVCQEMGISKSSLGNWLQAYRLGGEGGLEPGVPGPRHPRFQPALATEPISLQPVPQAALADTHLLADQGHGESFLQMQPDGLELFGGGEAPHLVAG